MERDLTNILPSGYNEVMPDGSNGPGPEELIMEPGSRSMIQEMERRLAAAKAQSPDAPAEAAVFNALANPDTGKMDVVPVQANENEPPLTTSSVTQPESKTPQPPMVNEIGINIIKDPRVGNAVRQLQSNADLSDAERSHLMGYLETASSGQAQKLVSEVMRQVLGVDNAEQEAQKLLSRERTQTVETQANLQEAGEIVDIVPPPNPAAGPTFMANVNRILSNAQYNDQAFGNEQLVEAYREINDAPEPPPQPPTPPGVPLPPQPPGTLTEDQKEEQFGLLNARNFLQTIYEAWDNARKAYLSGNDEEYDKQMKSFQRFSELFTQFGLSDQIRGVAGVDLAMQQIAANRQAFFAKPPWRERFKAPWVRNYENRLRYQLHLRRGGAVGTYHAINNPGGYRPITENPNSQKGAIERGIINNLITLGLPPEDARLAFDLAKKTLVITREKDPATGSFRQNTLAESLGQVKLPRVPTRQQEAATLGLYRATAKDAKGILDGFLKSIQSK